ncbi:MAG: hypothetical protein ACFFF4_10895 [Candidatus Thorarchaeota archaeon]
MMTMPHFGLIDNGMNPEEETLLRAKLHIRGGDVRLEKGELEDAIASYYDAFSSGMLRFYLSEELRSKYRLPNLPDLTDDHAIFLALKESGVIGESFTDLNFHQTEIMLNAAFEGSVKNYDYKSVLERLFDVMTELEVLPILAGELPEVNSITL